MPEWRRTKLDETIYQAKKPSGIADNYLYEGNPVFQEGELVSIIRRNPRIFTIRDIGDSLLCSVDQLLGYFVEELSKDQNPRDSFFILDKLRRFVSCLRSEHKGVRGLNRYLNERIGGYLPTQFDVSYKPPKTLEMKVT